MCNQKRGDPKTHKILNYFLQIEMFHAKLQLTFDNEKTHSLT
jgi:hypothetical protein